MNIHSKTTDDIAGLKVRLILPNNKNDSINYTLAAHSAERIALLVCCTTD